MNFLLPDQRALCLAENAAHNLHNLLTLRGALVRDPRSWSRYLTEAISVAHHGDLGVLQRPLSVLETQHATFAIVTP